MTKIDIEALPVDLHGIALANGLHSGITAHPAFKSFMREYKRAFAALLLEKAAQVCDGQVERWTDDRARYCASECAAGIRQMAAGMGE